MNKLLFIVSLLLSVIFNIDAQATRFVKLDALGQNNGTSWQDAFVNINTALNNSSYGDTLWIAQGVYYPSNDTNRDTCFSLKNGVCLYGGFVGDETQLIQRNFTQNPTILSGDIGVKGDSTDNCYNVLRGTHLDTTTTIDGFIIEKGYANLLSPTDPMINRSRGGGMFLRPKTNALTTAPYIKNCIFRKNYAINGGLAIRSFSFANSTGNPTIESCQFYDNFGNVAFIYMSQQKGNISITRCRIGKNGISGSILIDYYGSGGDTITIEQDTFSAAGNKQRIYISNYDLKPYVVELKKLIFSNNSEVRLDVSGEFPSSVLNVSECRFINNDFFNWSSGLKNSTFANNLVENNTTVHFILPANNVHLLLQDNTFRNNKNTNIGITGQLESVNNIFSNSKINMDIRSKTAHYNSIFTNTVFYQNQLKIKSSNNLATPDPIGTIFNFCSFIKNEPWADTLSIFNFENMDTLAFNSCLLTSTISTKPIIGNKTGSNQYVYATNTVFESTDCNQISIDSGTEICTANNLVGTPLLFTDTMSGNFHLQPCSAGINFGDLSTVDQLNLVNDFSSMPRIANGLPDAGALETIVAPPTATITNAACYGAQNGSVQYSDDCNNYSYTWVDNNGNTGTQIDSVAAGVYFITLSSINNGITFFDTVQVSEPINPWQVDIAIVPASGSVALDGMASAVVSSGNGPFEYLWSTGATTSQISQLLPATYSLTITDINGCKSIYTIIVGTVGNKDILTTTVNISPNPIRSGSWLNIESDQWSCAIIVDGLGRQIYTGVVTQQKLYIPESVNSGMYYLVLTDNKSGLLTRCKILITNTQ